MILVSGLQFAYDWQNKTRDHITSVRVANGEALNPEKVYTVATNSLLADGGCNYRAFLQGKERQEHGSQYDMIKTWMAKTAKVAVPEDVRIVSKAVSSKR